MVDPQNPQLFYNFSGRDLPDYAKKTFDSMIVSRGRILLKGFAFETMAKYLGIPRVDLAKAVVLPAFADAHVHFLQTGLMLSGCRLEAATTLSELFDLLRMHLKSHNEPWVLGWNLDETRLKERRLPTVQELDALESRRKIWISRIDLHSAVPNSRALEWAVKENPQVALDEGRLRKDPYYILANRLIGDLSPETKRKSLNAAKNACIATGISSVHALEGGDGLPDSDVELVADFLREPGFHGVLYHQSENPQLALKNRWNRLGGCLFVDGSFGSRTASLTQPYEDDPGNRGCLYRNQEKIEELLRRCHRENLQLALHAIGDFAIGTVTAAYQWAAETLKRPALPHRIEHFELPNNVSLRQAKEAGAFISVQPAFEVFWGGPEGMYARRLGLERTRMTNPFRTMLNYGLPLAGGSDSPVTPINPMLGLHGFLNHPNPDERIDLNSALAAFILEPHRFSGEDEFRGRLETGCHADFICLSQDPFMIPPSQIKSLQVKRLFIEGREANHDSSQEE